MVQSWAVRQTWSRDSGQRVRSLEDWKCEQLRVRARAAAAKRSRRMGSRLPGADHLELGDVVAVGLEADGVDGRGLAGSFGLDLGVVVVALAREVGGDAVGGRLGAEKVLVDLR